MAVTAASIVFFAMRGKDSKPILPPPDFDTAVSIPPNAPEEEPDDENGMPSRNQLTLARIDAWVLTHDLFADLKDGKITREKAVSELRRMVRLAKTDEFKLFESDMTRCDSYTQVGETTPLVYLLKSAISNLTVKATKNTTK